MKSLKETETISPVTKFPKNAAGRDDTTTCSEVEVLPRPKFLEIEMTTEETDSRPPFGTVENNRETGTSSFHPRVGTPDTKPSQACSPNLSRIRSASQESGTIVFSIKTPKYLNHEISKAEACMLDLHRHLFRGVQRLYYGNDAVRSTGLATINGCNEHPERSRRRRLSCSKSLDVKDSSAPNVSNPSSSLSLKSIGTILDYPISMTQEKAAVMVIGNMCAGKSTFINWFAGDSLLRTGMCTETSGFTYISSGRTCVELNGESTLKYRKHLEAIAGKHEGFVKLLSMKTSPTLTSRLHLVDLIDTPGLVDGDVDYGCNIDGIIVDMHRFVDLYFVFFDPIGQALGKRVTSVVKRLNELCPEKLRFCLSKIDEVPTEEERIKVMCQTTQSLTSKIQSRHAFDLIPVYIPGARHGSNLGFSDQSEHEISVNRLPDLVRDINRVTLQRVHNLLDSLVSDIGLLESEVSRNLQNSRMFQAKMKQYRSDISRARVFQLFALIYLAAIFLLQMWDTFSPINLSPVAILLARWIDPERQAFFHNILNDLSFHMDKVAGWIRQVGNGFALLWCIAPFLMLIAFRRQNKPVDQSKVKDSTLQEYQEFLKAVRGRAGDLFSAYSAFAMDESYASAISSS